MMTTDQDQLRERLAAADPAQAGAAPQPGSPRYRAIQETIMSTTAQPAPVRHPKRRPAFVPTVPIALAAAAAAIVGVSALGGKASTASAAEVVRAAADRTGDTLTLRGRLVVEEDGSRNVTNVAVAGRDVRISSSEGEFAYVDGRAYERSSGGHLRTERPSQDEVNAPFAASSMSVVHAVLQGGVTRVGRQALRRQEATHYRIDLDEETRDRLAALPASQLAWFELEYPEQLRTMDVWVTDGLIGRVVLGSTDNDRTTTDFYDFGADITVNPLR